MVAVYLMYLVDGTWYVVVVVCSSGGWPDKFPFTHPCFIFLLQEREVRDRMVLFLTHNWVFNPVWC